MKTPYLIALLLTAFALGTVSLTAQSSSTVASLDESALRPDPNRLANMSCIQQLDQLGNFVKMLCVSPDPTRGGKMRYRTPARTDSEVWGDLDRQRATRPFWN